VARDLDVETTHEALWGLCYLLQAEQSSAIGGGGRERLTSHAAIAFLKLGQPNHTVGACANVSRFEDLDLTLITDMPNPLVQVLVLVLVNCPISSREAL